MKPNKPETRENWRDFMNGYRDPVGRAEDKEEERRIAKELGIEPGGGGMNSGGDGARECGHRKEGGVYAVVPTSANGKPVEHFILCKPLPINPEEYNLTNVGVKLVDIEETCLVCSGRGVWTEGKGKAAKKFTCQPCYGTGKELVTHVFDIIGQEYYPNVADFIEETRVMGVSRRLELETSANYARLSKRSRLFFLHAKAIINNPFEVYKIMEQTELMRLDRAGCPKGLPIHSISPAPGMDKILPGGGVLTAPGCSSLYWHVLEQGEKIPETKEDADYIFNKQTGEDSVKRYEQSIRKRFTERVLASGKYRGYALPQKINPEFSIGIFAIFPLARIEVVDPNGEYEEKVKKVSSAKVDVCATEC